MVEQNFEDALRCLTQPALASLEMSLREFDLSDPERQAVLDGTAEYVTAAVHRKLSRLLLLELNGARITGQLTGPDSAARWSDFIGHASRLEYWQSLEQHYPSLLKRVATVVTGRTAAGHELARRFASNRARLAVLCGAVRPELMEVSFGAGDSHRGGRSVATLTLGGGKLIYKPRPLGIDRALAGFLDQLFPGVPAGERIRVPAVLNCGTYGWSEFIEHRYCRSAAELATYYQRLGHWLALARLFGTTDLHAENLIACAATPIVVDCETLFTPQRAVRLPGAGDALDRAHSTLSGSLLTSGLLPSRGSALGWRGADISAAGALPGQQPLVDVPQIADAGTDRARLIRSPMPGPAAANLPSPEPDLHRYWAQVLSGFDELTARLRVLDQAGVLEYALAGFRDVDIRAVLRSTEVYAELGRMLWHPVSLHDESTAIERASTLLAQHSEANPAAPNDPQVIAGEVANLLVGDIPYFQTTPSTGKLQGPTEFLGWGEPRDVLSETLHRWRSADMVAERELIRGSVVCAYINDGYQPEARLGAGSRPDLAELEPGRRQVAAEILQRLVDSAIRGDDGTVTWIAPVLNPSGWSVQALSPDAYSGLPGVALVLASYQNEVSAGRADPVPGVPELAAAAVATMRAMQAYQINQQSVHRARPEPPGLYLGIGSQIWCWTALADLGAVEASEALQHATACGAMFPGALAACDQPELLGGWAGAVISLLRLAERTGDNRWLDLAVGAGERLVTAARWQQDRASWSALRWPDGLGGMAHGATGIGWALARLSQVTERADLLAVAQGAFAFEESLWDPAERGWRDLREPDDNVIAGAWCHGSVGIGLASADLLRRGLDTDRHADLVRRAASSAWQHGRGWSHTVCHGDMGCWEMMSTAFDLGLAPAKLTQTEVDAYVIGSIAEHGPTTGLARAAMVPGLIPGLSGVAYQLLRMHPDCPLPSILLIN